MQFVELDTSVNRKELKRKIQEAQEKLESTVDSLLKTYEGRTFDQKFFDKESTALKEYTTAHETAWQEYIQASSE